MNTSKSSKKPLYSKIRDYMLEQMQKQEWRENEQIPPEMQLAQQFNVSRITIRKAIADFVEDGSIYRVRGKGSFVSPANANEPIVIQSNPSNFSPQNQLVAFIIPKLHNSFTAHLLSGVENILTPLGYNVLFFETNDSSEQEAAIFRKALQLGVCGIVVFPVEGETYSKIILQLTLKSFPLVVIDRYLRGVETNCVCSDHIEGARMATEHLIHLGHSRIGVVSTEYIGTTSIEDRVIGYEKALIENGIPIDHQLRYLHADTNQVTSILQSDKWNDQTLLGFQKFLSSTPDMTAVFAINYTTGICLFEAAKRLEIKVPEQLSIVMFDDYELSVISPIPPTCVTQQEIELGKEAARLLVSIIEEPNRAPQRIVLPVEFIERQSTCKLGIKTTSS